MSDQYHCEPEGHSQKLFAPQLNPEFCLHSQSDEQGSRDIEYVMVSLKFQKKDEFIRTIIISFFSYLTTIIALIRICIPAIRTLNAFSIF